MRPTIEQHNKRLACAWRRVSITLMCLALSACGLISDPPPGIGDAVKWQALQGWQQDQQAQAWPALLSQCPRLGKKQPWQEICEAAKALPATPSDAQARDFFQTHFEPHVIHGTEGREDGLITGYYEPLLAGSRKPSERFRYPLYQRPKDLLLVDFGDVYPELKGKRVRARIEGNKVVPFFDRAAIDGAAQPLKGEEILWVDDPYAAFFLHIQGSGRVRLSDGSEMAVSYADQNGRAYVSIGKKLIERGALSAESVTLFSIRQWLEQNPKEAQTLMNENPSYVFFTLRESTSEGPRGSLNVPLTSERSAAVDRKRIPLGTPLWLDTTLPEQAGAYQRLLFAQDTGGAIVGPVRADVFFGRGERAERLAGTMKQRGKLYALVPKKPQQ